MKKIILQYLFLLIGLQSAAQEYVINLKHWDVKDGLPHRKVSFVYPARNGFLWISTPSGLSRFDGYQFITYTGDQNEAFNDVAGIAEDAFGNLWLGSGRGTSHAYYIFNPVTGQVKPMEQVAGDTLALLSLAMYTMGDSSLLMRQFESQDHESYTWKPGSGLTKHIIPTLYYIMTLLPEKNCIVAENDDHELVLLDLDGRILKKKKAPFAKGSVVVNRQRTVNMYMLDTSDQHVYRVSPDLDITDVTDILPPIQHIDFDIFDVNDSVMWMQGKLFTNKNNILRDFIAEKVPGMSRPSPAVIIDKNRMWIPNEFGLNMLSVSRNKFRQYYCDTSKTGYVNACRAIAKWHGSLYVTSEFGGLTKINMSTHQSTRLLTEYDYGLKITSVGLVTGNVNLLDEHNKIARFHPEFETGNSWCFYEYAPAKLLIGTFSGLIWFNERSGAFARYSNYNNYPEMAKCAVLYIGADKNGVIWACSSNGLYTIDTAKGITARYSLHDTGAHYLPAADFRHFVQDAKGIYWLATASGLIRWDRVNHSYKQYKQADGLSNNDLYAVYEDNFGNLWMSSDYGIMRINKASGTVKTYTIEDGITNNEFNRASHYKDDEGNIYLGTLCGVNIFDPRDFVTDSGTNGGQPLVITSFLQFNGSSNKLEDRKDLLLGSNTITINPNDRFFTLEFALLNYNNTQQTLYYWKIDGVDTGWNMQHDRVLRMSRLPYDGHILHVKAQAADGSWSKNELAIRINVIRPFYLRLWFLFFTLIAAVAAVVGGYRWRLYLLRKENERLDRVVTEKTEDLRVSLQQKEILLKEIHHRVKNNLQVISSLLRLQSHSVTDEAAKNALLEGQNRVLSIALIHQKLYQDEKIDKVEFSTFADELFGQLNGVFRKPGVEINFINEVPEIFLGIDVAVPLGLILNELITNSFKYAFKDIGQPTIVLKLQKNADQFILTYADNGPGLPEDINIERSKSLGLKLVSRLSKQLNGNARYIKNEFIIYFREL